MADEGAVVVIDEPVSTGITQSMAYGLLVFDSDRRIKDEVDETNDFVIFDSPLPVIEAVEGDQEFLVVEENRNLTAVTETGEEILVLHSAGLPGPPGPEGPPGAGVTRLTYTFASASTEWTVDHNLDTFHVEVNVFDLSGTVECEAEIEHTSANQVVVRNYYPTSGLVRIIG